MLTSCWPNEVAGERLLGPPPTDAMKAVEGERTLLVTLATVG